MTNERDMFHSPTAKISKKSNCPLVSTGDYVEIQHKYKAGICSEGGCGWVINVSEMDSVMSVDVKYIMSGITEKDICISRITVCPLPLRTETPTLRSASPLELPVCLGNKSGATADLKRVQLMVRCVAFILALCI